MQINGIQLLCEQHAIPILTQDFQTDIALHLGIRPDKFLLFQQALTKRSDGQLLLEKIK